MQWCNDAYTDDVHIVDLFSDVQFFHNYFMHKLYGLELTSFICKVGIGIHNSYDFNQEPSFLSKLHKVFQGFLSRDHPKIPRLLRNHTKWKYIGLAPFLWIIYATVEFFFQKQKVSKSDETTLSF